MVLKTYSSIVQGTVSIGQCHILVVAVGIDIRSLSNNIQNQTLIALMPRRHPISVRTEMGKEPSGTTKGEYPLLKPLVFARSYVKTVGRGLAPAVYLPSKI